MKTLILIIITLLIVDVSYGQDPVFDQLASKYKSARVTQDSLQSVADGYRTQLNDNPSSSAQLTPKIIALEDQLYISSTLLAEITSQMLSSNTSAAQDIIANYKPKVAKINNTRDLNSALLEHNYLAISDVKLFDRSAEVNRNINDYIHQIQSHYSELIELKARYDSANHSSQIDTLLAQSKLHIEAIKSLDTEINDIWQPIYDQKITKYIAIADNLGLGRPELEQIDELSRNVRLIQTQVIDQLAPFASGITVQQALILGYELIFAHKLSLDHIYDSITAQIAALSKQQLQFPAISFPYRNTTLYSKVINDGAYDFPSVESIPILDIPPKDVYYTIQIHTSSEPIKNLAVLRKLRPVRVTKSSSGSYRYVVGGFKKYSDAQSALAIANRAGFSGKASIQAWVDGVSTSAVKAKATQEAIDKANAGNFILEITTQNEDVIANLRDLTDRFVANLQITRTKSGENTLLTVAGIKDRAIAEKLAEIIEQNQRTTVKITKTN